MLFLLLSLLLLRLEELKKEAISGGTSKAVDGGLVMRMGGVVVIVGERGRRKRDEDE